VTRTARSILAVLVVLAFVAGCQTMTGKTAGQNVDDGTVTAAVKAKLVADKASNLTRVNVDTTNGTVYLNGAVEDAATKARAEQLAWQAKGVKAVVNNLQVTGK
jgi:hyperosmotically inducible periplasmic protein